MLNVYLKVGDFSGELNDFSGAKYIDIDRGSYVLVELDRCRRVENNIHFICQHLSIVRRHTQPLH